MDHVDCRICLAVMFAQSRDSGRGGSIVHVLRKINPARDVQKGCSRDRTDDLRHLRALSYSPKTATLATELCNRCVLACLCIHLWLSVTAQSHRLGSTAFR